MSARSSLQRIVSRTQAIHLPTLNAILKEGQAMKHGHAPSTPPGASRARPTHRSAPAVAVDGMTHLDVVCLELITRFD